MKTVRRWPYPYFVLTVTAFELRHGRRRTAPAIVDADAEPA